MREKPYKEEDPFQLWRITPASAGKTLSKAAIDIGYQDHPRECGKNSVLFALVLSNLGSPPRVREKHWSGIIRGTEYGITPASAGKTLKDPIEIANPD